MEKKYGSFNSWEIINDSTIIKTTDLSLFKHNGSGIPKQSKWFWNVDKILPGNKLSLTLIFDRKKYDAYIEVDKTKFLRARLFWYSDLGSIFRKTYPFYGRENSSYPLMRFRKLNSNIYEISLIDMVNDTDFIFNFESQKEGKMIESQSIRYERDSHLRSQAIKIHGLSCMACGFNFFETYGELGKGFIHVHHINPLSSSKEHFVNPEIDLTVLCPNCHSMVHRNKNHILTVEELKLLIKENSKLSKKSNE